MLMRLLRHRVERAETGRFTALLVDRGIRNAAAFAGLHVAWFARSRRDRRRRIAVSCWDDLAAVQEAVGDPERPHLLPEIAALTLDPRPTHFEVTVEPSERRSPPGRLLRLLLARVRPGAEAEYYESLRGQPWSQHVTDAGLIEVCAGRRSGLPTGERIVVASVWRDWDALAAVTEGHPDRPIPGWHPLELFLTSRVEHYVIDAHADRRIGLVHGAERQPDIEHEPGPGGQTFFRLWRPPRRSRSLAAG